MPSCFDHMHLGINFKNSIVSRLQHRNLRPWKRLEIRITAISGNPSFPHLLDWKSNILREWNGEFDLFAWRTSSYALEYEGARELHLRVTNCKVKNQYQDLQHEAIGPR
jgi:hypothetical protein